MFSELNKIVVIMFINTSDNQALESDIPNAKIAKLSLSEVEIRLKYANIHNIMKTKIVPIIKIEMK
ncbi:hypothetical protein [Paenibacillus odorifer]|uniref:hypothetical protein n=2 Tax=Paenibacillus TaxID=44249 RepID=UPI00096BE74B|nr:hypothetical protein [Paenibacillus odorifer]OMD87811.1 hypothetical protein BSK53_02140 [Paenibacillus odorifer]